MALGLTLMFGMMHIINFAHGAVYMLGAFVIYYIFSGGAAVLRGLLVAMLILGAFGFVVERPSTGRSRAALSPPWWRSWL